MEADDSHTVTVVDRGVPRLPVPILGDGGVHLLFDLTHGVVSFELRSL